jgi:putative PIN family toxin of toxin-antitoxin system
MRAVIDTNVIVSSFLSPQSIASRILDLWKENAFELLVSEAIIEEYQRVLAYPKFRITPDEIARFVKRLRKNTHLIPPQEPLTVIKADPSDNKFIECAVYGEADTLVSADKDVLNLGRYRHKKTGWLVTVMSPHEFVEEWFDKNLLWSGEDDNP